MLAKVFLIFFLGAILSAQVWAADPGVDFSQSRVLPLESRDMLLYENVILGEDRYALIMQLDASLVLKPIWAGILETVEIPFRSMTIDGDNADWAGLAPVVRDPAGDENPQYSSVIGTDLGDLFMARDDMYLYFLLTMHDGGPLENPQTLYVVEFQQYLTQIHTPGDLFANVSYTLNDGWSVEINDRGPGSAVASYPSDFVGIGAGQLEWKVPIEAMQYPPDTPAPYFSLLPPPPGIENQFIRVYIHPGPHENPPPVSDTNDALTRPMIVKFYP